MSQSYTIGIVGGSASGKTTVLNAVLEHFDRSQVVLISQDNYYHPREKQQKDPRGVTNFDLPAAIDMAHFAEHVKTLRSGQSIAKEEYTFNNDAVAPKMIEIRPAPVVIIEGLFVFHEAEIDKLLDYRVYIDCDPDVRLERRIKRDSVERGYPEDDVRYRWKYHVRPADLTFVEPHKTRVDLTIDNTEHFDEATQSLMLHIQSCLNP